MKRTFNQWLSTVSGARVAQWVRSLDL